MFFVRLVLVGGILVIVLAGDIREVVPVKHVEIAAVPPTYEVTLGALLQVRRAPNVCVVDARQTGAFADGHISGAINLPREVSGVSEDVLAVLRSARNVVVYCDGMGSSRSYALAQDLGKRGLRYVAVYAGGFSEWTAAGLPIEKGELHARKN